MSRARSTLTGLFVPTETEKKRVFSNGQLFWIGVFTYGFGDLVTTWLHIQKGGTEAEANPLMRKVMELAGFDALIVVKGAYLGWMYYSWKELENRRSLLITALLGAFVTLWNANLYFRKYLSPLSVSHDG